VIFTIGGGLLFWAGGSRPQLRRDQPGCGHRGLAFPAADQNYTQLGYVLRELQRGIERYKLDHAKHPRHQPQRDGSRLVVHRQEPRGVAEGGRGDRASHSTEKMTDARSIADPVITGARTTETVPGSMPGSGCVIGALLAGLPWRALWLGGQIAADGEHRPWAAVVTLVISSMWGPVASSPEPHRLGRYAMTTIASTSVVVYDPDQLDPEHVALAGFLGGYRGLTRDAYALDLRPFVHSPAVHVRRPRIDYESHAIGLDRNEVGALLVAAGLGPAPGPVVRAPRTKGRWPRRATMRFPP
jgi:hypothetical protein